jgi:hypothetical protein
MQKRSDIVLKSPGNVIKFNGAISSAKSLDEIASAVIDQLKHLARGKREVGYICGIATSDGFDFLEENKSLLRLYTDHLSKRVPYNLFCTGTVFDLEMEKKIKGNSQFVINNMWARVMHCGAIKHMFMTPRWHLSTGSRVEFLAAIEKRMVIHHLNSDPELLTILKGHSPQMPLSRTRKCDTEAL